MSLTTLEIAGSDYLSYASVAEADRYLLVDPVRGDVWQALDESRKASYLVSATRRMDTLNWPGKPTVSGQETAWPRTGVKLADGTEVGPDEIPKALENATILFAGTIAIKPKAGEADSGGNQFKRLKAGSAEVEYIRGKKAPALDDSSALALLRAAGLFGASAYASTVGGFASGTDRKSAFDDGYGLTEGYS